MRPQRAAVEKDTDDVRRGLVNALFVDSRSMIQGCVASVTSACIAGILTGLWTFWAIGCVTVLVTLARVVLVRMHTRWGQSSDEVDRYERLFMLGTDAYLACSSALTVCALLQTDNTFLMLLTSLVSFTNAFSIAVRSYAIRYGLGLHVSWHVHDFCRQANSGFKRKVC